MAALDSRTIAALDAIANGDYSATHIRGQARDVRYLREAWGRMTVLHGSANERAAVTGTLPVTLRDGDTVDVDGAWSQHPTWGWQFKARSIRISAPCDASGAIEWMRGRLPQVGRKLATAIVERWPLDAGEDSTLWRMLDHDCDAGGPSPLERLRGVTPERARAIHAAYREHSHTRAALTQLLALGLTEGQCARLQKALGPGALDAIRQDPYQLIARVDGFGWKRADALARRLGLSEQSPLRVAACLNYMLDEAANQGHVYVPAGKLVNMAARELGIDARHIWPVGREAIAAGKLRQRGSRVYRRDVDAAEASIAADVLRLLKRAA